MPSTPYVSPNHEDQPDELRAPSPASYQMNAVTVPQRSVASTWRAAQLLYLLAGIIEAVIIARVALKLLAANSDVGFVRFVNALSAPLVAPFQGIFPTPTSNTNVLELSSLVAIVVYGLLAWGIVSLIVIVGRRPIPTTAG